MVTPDPPLITMEDIRKRYGAPEGPTVEVLRGVSLTIRRGEFVAIVGTSGSGKSTLMHLLGCLDRPTSGTFRFEGRDVAAMTEDEKARLRRESFGFVFQSYHLVATESALENVEVPAIYAGMPAAPRRNRAVRLLEQLGLGDRLHHRPHQLSGGQQQRVSIARALMNGGRILLADEPTGALDSRSGAEVMQLFEELAAAGHTIVLITHDRDVAARAHRILEIRDGGIVSETVNRHGVPAAHPVAVPNSRRTRSMAGLPEALRAAWRVMAVHRFRTALTLLGIIMGVASVIVMLGLSLGARERVLSQIGSMGPTAMYIYHEVPPEGGPIGEITRADIEEIRRLPRVRRVMPGLGEPVTLRFGNRSMTAYAQGSTEILPDMNRWPVQQGRYFTDAESQALAPVVVIGTKVRDRFFPDGEDPLGRILLLDTAPFEIIGIMAEKGSQSGEEHQDERVLGITALLRLCAALEAERRGVLSTDAGTSPRPT